MDTKRALKPLLALGLVITTLAAQADTPRWADKKSDKTYIYGIGMSFKNKTPKAIYHQTSERYTTDYVEEARREALKNLAQAAMGANVSGSGKAAELDIEPTRISGFDIYEVYESRDEYWIALRMTHEQAEKLRGDLRMDRARASLKSGKQEFRKSVFEKELD